MGNSPSYSSDSLKDKNSFFGEPNDQPSSTKSPTPSKQPTQKPRTQQDRVNFVLRKLKSLYPDFKDEKLLPFAETLADKNKLKDVYLHTDFSAAKKLQKKLNDTFNDSGNGSETSQQQYKGVFSFASGSAVEGIEALKEKENNNYEEEEEEIMENSFHLDKNSNINDTKIRVKLIVAETANSDLQKNIKKLLAPIVNSFVMNGTKFGIFHISLGIGPWKIEWNSSALCIPRAISGKAALLCADVEHITTLERLDDVVDKLADVIVKWNTEMGYKESGANSKKDKKGNCQQFIEDVLDALGVNLPDFPTPLKNFINHMKQTGSAEMDFIVTPEFAEHFHIDPKNHSVKPMETENELENENESSSSSSSKKSQGKNFKINFKTHQQLDIFTRSLMEIDSDFQYSYKFEYYMLKSFDRAFWMRYLKMRESVPEDKVSDFAPLKDEDGTLSCPFDDPEKFSFLEFKVQKPSAR